MRRFKVGMLLRTIAWYSGR